MQEVFSKIINRLNERIEHHEKRRKLLMDAGLHVEADKITDRILELDFSKNAVEQEVAEYNNGWIPCSVVDHPEHCNDCEVTMLDTHGYIRDIAFYTDKWRRASDEAAVTVIAWKEPTEPYHPKGEQHEKS